MADNTNNKSNTDTIDSSHSRKYSTSSIPQASISKRRRSVCHHLSDGDARPSCPFGLKSIDALKHAGYDIIDHITTQDENTLVKDALGVKTTPDLYRWQACWR